MVYLFIFAYGHHWYNCYYQDKNEQVGVYSKHVHHLLLYNYNMGSSIRFGFIKYYPSLQQGRVICGLLAYILCHILFATCSPYFSTYHMADWERVYNQAIQNKILNQYYRWAENYSCHFCNWIISKAMLLDVLKLITLPPFHSMWYN